MTGDQDPRLAMAAVRARYNEPGRYSQIDAWHRFTAAEIRRELSAAWPSLGIYKGHLILNAGAGGSDLGLSHPTIINLDISEIRVADLTHPVVGNIEALPLADAVIDTIVCVGSVINYCDAAAAISELGRVLRKSGHLVLEFESSRSAELMTQHAFGQSAAIANTFYAGQDEAIWVYTSEYVRNLLTAAGLTVIREIPIHVLSPWALLFLRNPRIASLLSPLDQLARYAHPITTWASNRLLFCRKAGEEPSEKEAPG